MENQLKRNDMESLKGIFLKESASPSHEIRFVGDYRKLESMGFEFVKMYAREYKTYINDDVYVFQEREGKNEEGDRIKIEYGEVEILDLHGESYLILQTLIDNNFNISQTIDLRGFGKHEINFLVLDRDTKTISFDIDSISHLEFESILNPNIPKEEVGKRSTEFYKRYRKVDISDETIATLKELYTKGMIEIR